MAQNPGIYTQGARIIVKYNLNGHALLTVYAKTDKLHKDSMTGLYFDLTFFHKYGIMQGVREEYSLAPFCIFADVRIYQNLEDSRLEKSGSELHFFKKFLPASRKRISQIF